MDVEQTVEHLGSMPVSGLISLTKALEKQWGVKAQPRAVAEPVSPPQEALPVEEKTEFDVELVDMGANKVNIIKAIREITGMGLKEAKETAEGAPMLIRRSVPKAEAEEVKAKLEAAGAKAAVK